MKCEEPVQARGTEDRGRKISKEQIRFRWNNRGNEQSEKCAFFMEKEMKAIN